MALVYGDRQSLLINGKFICLNCMVNLGVSQAFLLSDLLDFVLSI